MGDHTHALDITKLTVAKDKKSVTYSAKMEGMSGTVTGTIKFASAIDFEDGEGADSAVGKSTLKATMQKVSFDTKKASTGNIDFS